MFASPPHLGPPSALDCRGLSEQITARKARRLDLAGRGKPATARLFILSRVGGGWLARRDAIEGSVLRHRSRHRRGGISSTRTTPGLEDAARKAAGLTRYAQRHGHLVGRIDLVARIDGHLSRIHLKDDTSREAVAAAMTPNALDTEALLSHA